MADLLVIMGIAAVITGPFFLMALLLYWRQR